MQIMSRVRYNAWDLLGDVGGFNDGLVLVTSLIFSSVSAFSFKKDLINRTFVDGDVQGCKDESSSSQKISHRDKNAMIKMISESKDSPIIIH